MELWSRKVGLHSVNSKNQLGDSRSPYLLQHARNPVHWREWGEPAFAEARERDLPIFLSIGYSTCHWCHVMAHESFEDEAIAADMNARFVNVKVDREERPDVDRIYMSYVQSLTGGGGWPMSVWLTPDRKPFYGGTYFPPRSMHGRIGFRELIARIGELWMARRGELATQANKYVDTLMESIQSEDPSSDALDWQTMDQCYRELAESFDSEWGGFGGPPKFPMPCYLQFLFEYMEARESNAADERLISVTLDRMSAGGIHDFVAGGFHRYSVDRYWHVPHFEKMLYDQGQLAQVYAESARRLGRMDDLAIARDICRYVGEQLVGAGGGISSAEDADSPLPDDPAKSGEGAFYVWTAEELRALLGDEPFAVFRARFGIEDNGNVRPESDPQGEFRGMNALAKQIGSGETDAELEMSPAEVDRNVKSSLAKLKETRAKRPRPHLDDKALASWNGLMISGACSVYQASGDESCLALAENAGGFVWDEMRDPETSTLYRAYRQGRGEIPGFAEDYSSMALAYLDLYESTGEEEWLRRAEAMLDTLLDRFWDGENGGFFSSPSGDSSLIARLKDDYDGAEPSANSLAAIALLRLGSILGDERLENHGRKTVMAFKSRWERIPRSLPMMLIAAMRLMRPGQRIVFAGALDTLVAKTMRQTALCNRKRHSVIAYLHRESDWLLSRNPRYGDFPIAEDDVAVYVCDDYTCREPAYDADSLAAQLATT